jgi:transposase-like protein
MAQYQLTLESETVQRLFGESEQLRQLLEAVVNQVLEAQVAEHLQAEPYERTEERRGYRNGYQPRQLTTRVGTLHLRVPQVRDGSFSPELFERSQRSEQALVCTLMEMVVNGVWTRKVAQITEELCGKAFSKSTVSALCQGLDPLVSAWNEGSLAEQRYPLVLVDALVLKIREGGRVRARSALLAIGVNQAGYREILGLQLGDSESERSWVEYFVWLKGRGLSGVELVVSDSHGGLVNAVRLQFQGSSWQRCQTHLSANVSDAMPKALQDEVHRRVRQADPTKFLGHPKLPHYLPKQGRNLLTSTEQAISRAVKHRGYVVPSGLDIRVETRQTAIDQLRIAPHASHYTLAVIFERHVTPADVDPTRIAAVTFNRPGVLPFLVNGRPAKAINQCTTSAAPICKPNCQTTSTPRVNTTSSLTSVVSTSPTTCMSPVATSGR